MASLASVRRLVAISNAPVPDRVEIDEIPATPRSASQLHGGPWRAGRDVQLATVIPFLVATVLYAWPGYYDRLFETPPDIIGIPAGLVFQVVILAWAALGAVVIWQTRFRFMAALAMTACTSPAVVGVVLLPRVIELMMY